MLTLSCALFYLFTFFPFLSLGLKVSGFQYLGSGEKCVSRSVMSDSLRPHSPPGSSVHGVFQARTLEWVAISFGSLNIWAHISWSGTTISSGMCSCPLLFPPGTFLAAFLIIFPPLPQQRQNKVKGALAGTSLAVQWLRMHLPMQGT